MIENIHPQGYVKLIAHDINGQIIEVREFRNTILRTGRRALANSLANSIGDTYDFYVSRMLFGDGGTSSGVPKIVNTERTGLFGITRANKSVIATVDPNVLTRVVFTSVLDYDDANGYALNEMALQMNNGDLYSLTTFPDFNKTSTMSVTWLWSVSFV